MPTRLVSFRPRMIAGSPVSDTRRPHPAARVPELTELCLRVLIAPSASSPSVPNLTHHYGPALLPDPPPRGYGINPQLGAVLNACVPGSVADPPMMAAPNPPVEGEDAALGVSLCPSPKHDVGGWFVRHAEERFSWEAVVGGVGAGGSVPVRWRGCQVGCLDFMDGDDGEAAERVENAVMTINLQGGLDFEWGD